MQLHEHSVVSGNYRARAVAARFTVLSVSPMPQDHLMLRQALDCARWRVLPVATRRGALDRMRVHPVSVIICESMLEDGTWRDLLDQNLVGAEGTPLIVTSRLADEYLWSEVLNLGGYDVLAKPFSDREVRHVLQTVALRQAPVHPRTRAVGAA
jgi:DNA-binding response OmpR family regulator